MEMVYYFWNQTLFPYFFIGWLVSVPICAFVLGWLMGRLGSEVGAWVYWMPFFNVFFTLICAAEVLFGELPGRIRGWQTFTGIIGTFLKWTLFLPSTLRDIGGERGWKYREKLHREEFQKQFRREAITRRSKGGEVDKYNDN